MEVNIRFLKKAACANYLNSFISLRHGKYSFEWKLGKTTQTLDYMQ